MSTYDTPLFLIRKKIAAALFLFAFGLLSTTGYAQIKPLHADSIPLVGDEVVLTTRFEADLTKEEIREKTYLYLDGGLAPYSGSYLQNSPDSIVCRMVDYLEIESSFLQVFGMYMTYDMKLVFRDGACDLTIYSIRFMEKSNFEAQEKSARRLNMPEFTGKEVMVDKKYSPLLIKNASKRVTDASITRFNEIIESLERSFIE